MCYLGPPPTGVYNLETGEGKFATLNGKWLVGELKEGFYDVPGTGSYYCYYDGVGAFCGRNDWGPPSKDYWPETGGYPPKYAKYDFCYPPEKDYIWELGSKAPYFKYIDF